MKRSSAEHFACIEVLPASEFIIGRLQYACETFDAALPISHRKHYDNLWRGDAMLNPV
jgi:hypothetical protein